MAQSTKFALFLSYSQKDSSFITSFKERVEDRGIQWMDSSGMTSFDIIQDRIDECQIIVPFISESFLQSDNCNKEFALANDWKKKILPVKLVSGRWPPKGKLAAELAGKPFLDGTTEIDDEMLDKILETLGFKPLSSSIADEDEEPSNEGPTVPTTQVFDKEEASRKLPKNIKFLLRLLQLESVKDQASEVIRVTQFLHSIALITQDKRNCINAGAANVLTLLLNERSVQESGGAVASIAKLITEISKYGPGKYAFVEAGAPAALSALACAKAVKKDGAAAGRLAAALWKLASIDIGNQASIDAGAVLSLLELAKESAVKENGTAVQFIAGALWHFAKCDSGRQACLDANAPSVLSALLLEKSLLEMSDAVIRISGALFELSKSEFGRQSCIDANVPSFLTKLAQTKAVKENGSATGNIAAALMEIAVNDAGRQACIDSDSPSVLVSLLSEKAVLENADAMICITQALKEISKTEAGKQACIAAGFPMDKFDIESDSLKYSGDTIEGDIVSPRTRFNGFIYSIVMKEDKSHGFIYVKQTTDPELWSRVYREAPDTMRKFEGQSVATIVFQASDAVEGDNMIPLENNNRLYMLPSWRNEAVTFEVEFSSRYNRYTGHRVKRVTAEKSNGNVHPHHDLALAAAHEKTLKASVSRGLLAMGAGETISANAKKDNEQVLLPILQTNLTHIGDACICYIDTNEKLIASCEYLRKSIIVSHSSIAIDMHGVQLGKDGEISILQMSSGSLHDPVFIVDILQLKEIAFKSRSPLRLLLEDETVPKLFFDVRGDVNALYHQFRITIRNLEDLQLIDIVKRRVIKYFNFTSVFSSCQDVSLAIKHHVQSVRSEAEQMFAQKFGGNYMVWMKRPLHPILLEFAADVRFYNLMRSSIKPFTPAVLTALQRATERRVEFAQGNEFSVTDVSNGTTDKLFLQELVSGPVVPCMNCNEAFPLSRLLLCNSDIPRAVKHALCGECLDAYAKVQIAEQRIGDGFLRCSCDRDGMKPSVRCTSKPWTVDDLNKVLSKETMDSFLKVASTTVHVAKGIVEDGGAAMYLAAASWNSTRISNQSNPLSSVASGAGLGASSSSEVVTSISETRPGVQNYDKGYVERELIVEKAPKLLPYDVVELARIIKFDSVKKDKKEVARVAIWIWGIANSLTGKQACITAKISSSLADLISEKVVMNDLEASRSVFGALDVISKSSRFEDKHSLFHGQVFSIIVREDKHPHGYIRVTKDSDLELWLKVQRETPEVMRTHFGEYVATIVFRFTDAVVNSRGGDILQEFLSWKEKDVSFEIDYLAKYNSLVAKRVQLRV
jgi:exonuclease 3'-5' domain-containing protein 1